MISKLRKARNDIARLQIRLHQAKAVARRLRKRLAVKPTTKSIYREIKDNNYDI